MSESEFAILTALIMQHSGCTQSRAQSAAQSIIRVGFHLVDRDMDAEQNEVLGSLEDRLHRLEGWSGLPRIDIPNAGERR